MKFMFIQRVQECMHKKFVTQLEINMLQNNIIQ
jgi:hypothetical protein